MNNLRNSVRLIGRIGQEPDLKKFDGGRMLAKFSLATSETYKDEKGERITETHWHNIVSWGKQAELISTLLHKGSEVAIEGKIITRNYVDKDGIKRYVTEIVMNEFLLIGKKEDPLKRKSLEDVPFA